MRRSAWLFALLLSAALLSTGCLTNSQTNTLQTDIDSIQSQIIRLQKEHAAIGDQLSAQDGQMKAVLAKSQESQMVNRADLLAQVETFSREMEILAQKLEDTNYRLSTLSAEIVATRNAWAQGRDAGAQPPAGAAPDASGPDGAPAGAGGSATTAPPLGPPSAALTGGAPPEEIFNTAYADYTKGNYPLAILGFQEYREKFPGSDFADDSLYWVGESYYSQGKFSDAVAAFGEVIRRYPDGDKVPSAHLKRGFAFLELNQTAQGVVQLNALIEDYPHTDEARLARDRLRALGLRDR